MKRNNVLQQKSFDFAVRIVNLCRYLNEEKKEYILTKQLLRAGTSIGANVEEAIGGQSEKDFFAKITIEYKEGRESHYWIRLLVETNYLTKEEGISILEDADELLRIIGSIQTTIKHRNS
ncbi:four helix bundle protein [Marinifilum sp. D737]|jgi:four helix bundle protein|uniref:four helix bundle protein n=1 Tax=Marinifilum sp. D737 TaxID=2969628 RepID=UPI0022735C23|nr:four helix bundle protein [Marinifilum sp. D737]MCY1632780.1 four helix bundle protein [Marinifilum sp. D737]